MLLACSQILVNFSLSVLIEKVFIYKKKCVIERNVYGTHYEPKTKRRELREEGVELLLFIIIIYYYLLFYLLLLLLTEEEDCIALLMKQKLQKVLAWKGCFVLEEKPLGSETYIEILKWTLCIGKWHEGENNTEAECGTYKVRNVR